MIDPDAEFNPPPLLETARENKRAVEKLYAAARWQSENNDTPNPSGQQGRLYSDHKLTSSGNTLTTAPCDGQEVRLYSAEGWIPKPFSAAVTLSTAGYTTDKKYDLFLTYDDGSELWVLSATAWTNETTQAITLDTVDGIQLLSTDYSYRYLGWGRYNGSTMLVSGSDAVGMTYYGTGNPLDPTGADPFTGIIINADGVYGYLAGVLQASLTSLGAVLAGAGAVILDALGIRVVVSTTPDDIRAYTFTNSDGSIVYGGMYGFAAAGDSTIRTTAKETAGNNSINSVEAIAPSGKTAKILLSVDDGAGGQLDITIQALNGVATLDTSGINSISLATTDANIELTSGSSIRLQAVAGAGVVVNDDNLDADFRVASDTKTHALFVQGSDGFIGINNTAPTYPLDVVGEISRSGVPISTGWTPVTDTWAYASASTITIPTDGTLTYQKGDYIRLKQGAGYKYYTVASLTATVITIIINTDYTVANAAITDVAYSRAANPLGWPGKFNCAVTVTSTASGPPTYTTNSAYYRPCGTSIKVDYDVTLTNLNGGTGSVIFSTPLTAALRTAAFGRETTTGVMLQGVLPAAAAVMTITNYANATVLVINYRLVIAFTMEF